VNKKLVITLTVALMMTLACSFVTVDANTVRGSGKVISETRNLSGFTSIELQGLTDVELTLEESESVVVEAEDNLVPLIETKVQSGKLIVGIPSNTNVSTTKPMRVKVTMKALNGIVLSGSGNIKASDLEGKALKIDLSGSGNITVKGEVDSVNITLSGSGEVICDELKAQAAAVTLNGSGNVQVYASESLEATIGGSGNIRYSGDPAKVSKHITGSGSIGP
jgi:predicted small secreted protein